METHRDADRELLVEVARQLRGAGLFASCAAQYRRRLWVLAPLFVAAWALLLAPIHGVGFVATAVIAGGLAVQLGIVAHDAGHHAVDRRGWVNELWGQLGMSVANGLGFRFWRHQHDLHHLHTQSEELDPDMDYAAVLSVFPRSAVRKRGVARVVQRWQAYYFWLIGAVGYPYALRWRSVHNLVRVPDSTRVERWALLGHFVWWLGVPALVVGPAPALLAYAIVSLVTGALLTALFSVNHMGMPSLGPGQAPSYLRRQVETARNLELPALVAPLYAGLDYQIEHHLFPSIGAANLPAARRVIEPLCRRHGLAYESVGLIAAQRAVLAHLDEMGRLANDRGRASSIAREPS